MNDFLLTVPLRPPSFRSIFMHRRQKYSHGSYNSAKATHFASVAKSRFKSQFIVYSRFLACLQYSPKPEHLSKWTIYGWPQCVQVWEVSLHLRPPRLRGLEIFWLPPTATKMNRYPVPEVHHSSGERIQSPLLESRGPHQIGFPFHMYWRNKVYCTSCTFHLIIIVDDPSENSLVKCVFVFVCRALLN